MSRSDPPDSAAETPRPAAPPEPDRTWSIGPGDAGLRLDRFLARELDASRAAVRRLLDRGGVRVDDRPVAGGAKGQALAAGRRVAVAGWRPAGAERVRPEPADSGFELVVLAEGPGWIAIDKPAGRAVHPLEPGETGSVLNALVRRRPELQGVGEGGLRSGVVHRLDVETSGVLCVATDEATWQRLRAAFREHRVGKRYRALVAGAVPDALLGRHVVGLRVARHRPARVRVESLESAGTRSDVRACALEILSIERLAGDASELAIRLETGFLHQVRATLAHLGHPVLGDALYGGERAGVARPMLHAEHLAFEEIEATAPWPEDFAAARAAAAGACRAG